MANCDMYGFFNGILGIEQANWAKYWKGIIPDGIIAGIGDEMVVSRTNTQQNLEMTVGTGEAMVDNHKAWITSRKSVTFDSATSSKPRIDAVVLRCEYGNSGESKIEVTVIKGTAAATPVAPTIPTNVTGGVCYLPLAYVRIAGSGALANSAVTDLRYVFKMTADSIVAFSRTSGVTTATVKPLNDREYRCAASLSALTIDLPKDPHDTFITGVCFTSGTSTWEGVTWKRGGANYDNIKKMGDSLDMKKKRYELIIWWDSTDSVAVGSSDTDTGHYWVAIKGL